MNDNKPVLFDSALEIAVDRVKIAGTVLGDEIFLIRDLRGRIRVFLPGRSEDFSGEPKKAVGKLGQQLWDALGAYAFPADRAVLYAGDLEQGDEILYSTDHRLVAEEDGLKIWLIDRQIIGQDWIKGPLRRETTNPRVTFFGIKGGVGRSTALAVWAWQLAKDGKKVLVMDLDLESPGVSSTLLPFENLPDHGIVDWFVEDGVGQANLVENGMIVSSPLARDMPGEIRVVPAFGRPCHEGDTEDYLPKLARCYSDFSGNQPMPWAERLQRMVEHLEIKENPDLVILDSRAGLHDIAAATVTRMDADAFLFAVDSMQTWNAYAFLFKHWRKHPQIQEFRRKLQIVAGMVPETGRAQYFKSFLENSWDLFLENVYDEAGADAADVFSFDLDSPEAPHYPLPIYWNRALQEFDPLRNAMSGDRQIAEAAMGEFLKESGRMVFAREENRYE